MTCCVAVAHGSKIYMAGDSRVYTEGGGYHTSALPKVWRKRAGKHWVGFGFSGDGCYHARMLYELNPPPQRSGESVGDWLFGVFERATEIYLSTTRKPLPARKDQAAAPDDEGDDGWLMLCCFRGHISYFDSVGEFDVVGGEYAAVGCGSQAAEGYLASVVGDEASLLAENAVKTACKVNLFCGEPIVKVEV